MREAAESVAKLDPMFGGAPLIRTVAVESLAADRPTDLGHKIGVRPPSFYNRPPLICSLPAMAAAAALAD